MLNIKKIDYSDEFCRDYTIQQKRNIIENSVDYALVLHGNFIQKIDITEYAEEIKGVLFHAFNGGYDGTEFEGLLDIESLVISEYSIDLELSEVNKHWHDKVDKILLSETDLSKFCWGKENNKLFNWVEIYVPF